MDSQLAILLLTLLSYLSCSQAWNGDASATSKSANFHSATDQQHSALVADSEANSMEKRQLVPLPRIGRSLLYAKRQSAMIPAPRIGRSDSSLRQSSKASNAVDCSVNPELCENTGSSGGYTGSNDDLVEPIDIQLRAAFIPRLGKRRTYSEEDNRASDVNSDNNKPYRKLVLIPGFGYIDADAANIATGEQQDGEDGEATQRNTLIRSILESAKRAIPYTPRIGRAVFAPRIGKKATFVPRIG